ncbi:hypothetical protein [Paenibacillus silvisoli]|nr:hypothetical protein [Paenibacillus silvisoli]
MVNERQFENGEITRVVYAKRSLWAIESDHVRSGRSQGYGK